MKPGPESDGDRGHSCGMGRPGAQGVGGGGPGRVPRGPMGPRKGPGKEAAQERAVKAKKGAGLEKGRKKNHSKAGSNSRSSVKYFLAAVICELLKIIKKIVTVLENYNFCILFQLHRVLGQLKPG
jgi:hypothetical protein